MRTTTSRGYAGLGFCCQKIQSGIMRLNAAWLLLSWLLKKKQPPPTNHQAVVWGSWGNFLVALSATFETLFRQYVPVAFLTCSLLLEADFIFPLDTSFSVCHCVGQLTFCSLCRGISAVCAYTVGDLHNVFMTSRLSGSHSARSRQASVEKDLLLHMKLDWIPLFFVFII